MKHDHIKIHETAFFTCAFRAFDEELSQDPYAKLWQNPSSYKWIQDYLNEVSSEETYTHCLRNRYFLDTITTLIEQQGTEVLINFGCGFSMYPFLINQNLVHIEIDKPEIINYKKSKVKAWQEAKILPNRKLHYLGVDFTQNYEKELLTKIYAIKADRPCFILIEGVLFFLQRKDTDQLFNFFDQIQNSGDFVGSASFQDSIKETSAFKKLLHFISRSMSKTSENDYQTVNNSYYHSKKNYTLIDHQDYYSLSKKYGHRPNLTKESILNENFYLLKKK